MRIGPAWPNMAKQSNRAKRVDGLIANRSSGAMNSSMAARDCRHGRAERCAHPEVDMRVFDVMHETLVKNVRPALDARSTDVGKTLVKSV